MLTERQQQILDFIQRYREERQYPPSVREIGRRFGICPATVQDHLAALEKKGQLQRQRFQSRALAVSGAGKDAGKGVGDAGGKAAAHGVAGVPVVGRVAAGAPLLAEQNIEDVVQLPPDWAAPGTFLLRVHGDSMIDAHILDGDYVLVAPRTGAANGEIVVALIGDEATVKRFYKTARGVTLKPENPRYAPIEIRNRDNRDEDAPDFRIVGRVDGVFRPQMQRLLKQQTKKG